MEDLQRQLKEKDELIALLNEERFRQSRVIAHQSEIIGSRNRSIDQLCHSRRFSMASRSSDHAPSPPKLLPILVRALERQSRGDGLSTGMLPLILLGLSYVNGDSVHVKKRRRRSLPSRVDEIDQQVSELSSPDLSAHSEGEEPSGGFDLELIYYSPQAKVSKPNNTLSGKPFRSETPPIMTDLSPRRSKDEFASVLCGVYDTPLGLTEIKKSAKDIMSGMWGAQRATFEAFSYSQICATLELSRMRILAVRDPNSGDIRWNSGQVWFRKSTSLGGIWKWGEEPHIELMEKVSNEEGRRLGGIWGAQSIEVAICQDNKVRCDLASGISVFGVLEDPCCIRWENGQVWRKNDNRNVKRRSG
jgi:hypothetical protein